MWAFEGRAPQARNAYTVTIQSWLYMSTQLDLPRTFSTSPKYSIFENSREDFWSFNSQILVQLQPEWEIFEQFYFYKYPNFK